MGNETIFYYVTEEAITDHKRDVNIHFWQKMKLSSFVTEDNGITVITVMIPYLKKGWKKEKLLHLMREGMMGHPMYSGDAGIVLQPEIQRILTQTEVYLTDSPLFWSLSKELLQRKLPELSPRHDSGSGLQSVVLLLGNVLFPEEQMQRFMEMMQPYFPRINQLMILYEMDDTIKTDVDVREEVIEEYTEEIYYEYGLVTQVRMGSDLPVKRHSVRIGQSAALFLDYGYPTALPLRALKEGDIYLDVFSSETKEALFRRKYMEISYLSPRKYLDTMVKSGYDKLVNQALCQK